MICRRISSLLAVVVFLGLQSLAFPAEPQERSAEGIAFLHLKFIRDHVELTGFRITPGRLKTGPRHAGERILLQVLSSDGLRLWEGTVPDPRVALVEGGQHEHGRPAGKVVERVTPELTVRVPFFDENQTVCVLRVSPGQGATAHQKVLGTFHLKQ